ncbi:MAG TPA: AI-2E family transporter [Candidatus Acidoferrum sp.]|jgi:predicted PurR-regulated permease PerM
MLAEQRSDDHRYVDQAVEASIHIGLLVLLAVACLGILAPFLVIIAWGAIIAVAAYPAERKLEKALGGRRAWSSVMLTLVILAFLIVPMLLLAGTLVDGVRSVAIQAKDGTLNIPPPPETVQKWPVVGVPLANAWSMAATNLSSALRSFAPQMKVVVQRLLSASAGISLTVLQFALSIVVAGFILANAEAAAGAVRSLANRIFGENGPDFERLVESTIRSVTTGIFGVALIQAVLAGLGFLFVGLPGAGLWAVLFLIAAILQVGVLVLIPAVIYAFTVVKTTSAVIFLVWCLLVGLLDNVLKPILLGRGAAVPMVVVFLGAIGGFIGMGMIGLFIGAIVLSVGYKLFLAWLEQGRTAS